MKHDLYIIGTSGRHFGISFGIRIANLIMSCNLIEMERKTPLSTEIIDYYLKCLDYFDLESDDHYSEFLKLMRQINPDFDKLVELERIQCSKQKMSHGKNLTDDIFFDQLNKKTIELFERAGLFK